LLSGECAVDTAPVENGTTGEENGDESDGTNVSETTRDATTESDGSTRSDDLSFGLVPAGLAVIAALATVGAVALWRRGP